MDCESLIPPWQKRILVIILLAVGASLFAIGHVLAHQADSVSSLIKINDQTALSLHDELQSYVILSASARNQLNEMTDSFTSITGLELEDRLQSRVREFTQTNRTLYAFSKRFAFPDVQSWKLRNTLEITLPLVQRENDIRWSPLYDSEKITNTFQTIAVYVDIRASALHEVNVEKEVSSVLIWSSVIVLGFSVVLAIVRVFLHRATVQHSKAAVEASAD